MRLLLTSLGIVILLLCQVRPDYLSGLVDGEGGFYLIVGKDAYQNGTPRLRMVARFQIALRKDDEQVLRLTESYNIQEPSADEQLLSDLLTEEGMCQAGGKHAIVRHLGPKPEGQENGN